MRARDENDGSGTAAPLKTDSQSGEAISGFADYAGSPSCLPQIVSRHIEEWADPKCTCGDVG